MKNWAKRSKAPYNGDEIVPLVAEPLVIEPLGVESDPTPEDAATSKK